MAPSRLLERINSIEGFTASVAPDASVGRRFELSDGHSDMVTEPTAWRANVVNPTPGLCYTNEIISDLDIWRAANLLLK
jgi:hypothetical protein